MLLTIDIGNTSTKFSVFNGDAIVVRKRIKTTRTDSETEISKKASELRKYKITDVAISSVVRELRTCYSLYSELLTGSLPLFADHTCNLNFEIKYEPPADCGPDRLVAAFGAVERVGLPVIVCDFGTATTIDLVNSENEYCGGIIAPGIETMSDSLFEKTSRLPKVKIEAPNHVVGNSTVESIKSGIYYGYVGLVDGIIERMQTSHDREIPVVSTGGYANLIGQDSRFVSDTEPDLIHYGLKGIWEINSFGSDFHTP